MSEERSVGWEQPQRLSPRALLIWQAAAAEGIDLRKPMLPKGGKLRLMERTGLDWSQATRGVTEVRKRLAFG